MTESKTNWMKKPEEVEKIIVELARQGVHPAKIGVILRDQHGVPRMKASGKKLTKVMKDAKITLKTETERIKERIENLEKHRAKNKHDYQAQRSAMKHSSRLRSVA